VKTQKHGVELGEGPGEKKTFFRGLLLSPPPYDKFFCMVPSAYAAGKEKNILLYAESMTQAD